MHLSDVRGSTATPGRARAGLPDRRAPRPPGRRGVSVAGTLPRPSAGRAGEAAARARPRVTRRGCACGSPRRCGAVGSSPGAVAHVVPPRRLAERSECPSRDERADGGAGMRSISGRPSDGHRSRAERSPSPSATVAPPNTPCRVPIRRVTGCGSIHYSPVLPVPVCGRGDAEVKRSSDRPRPPERGRWWGITHWEVWQVPARVLTAIVLVEGLAAAVVGIQAATLRPQTVRPRCSPARWRLLGIVHTEVAGKVERMRRRVAAPPTTTSARCGPSPPRCCCPRRSPRPSSSRVYLHLWVRVWRPAKSLLYRNVYTTAVGRPGRPGRARRRRAVRWPAQRDGRGDGPRRARAGRAGLRRGEQRTGHRRHRADTPRRRPAGASRRVPAAAGRARTTSCWRSPPCPWAR